MQDLFVSPLAKAFFSANSRTCRNMLLDCSISELEGEILVSTRGHNRLLALAITLRRDSLINAMRLSGVKCVVITTGSEIWAKLPLHIIDRGGKE